MLERGSTAQLLLALLVAFLYLVLAINTSPLLKWEADRMNQVDFLDPSFPSDVLAPQ